MTNKNRDCYIPPEHMADRTRTEYFDDLRLRYTQTKVVREAFRIGFDLPNRPKHIKVEDYYSLEDEYSQLLVSSSVRPKTKPDDINMTLGSEALARHANTNQALGFTALELEVGVMPVGQREELVDLWWETTRHNPLKVTRVVLAQELLAEAHQINEVLRLHQA